MKIGRWEGNEIIYTVDVVDNSVNLIEDFDFTFAIIGADTIMTGMVVTEAAVPDMTILISAGIAEDFTVGTFLVGEALIGTVTTSDPVNDRVDIVEMRRFIDDTTPATRQFKDPITEAISEQTIDTKTEYKTEIQVTAGTAAPSPVAPSVTSGWMKIAEILVPSSSTTVVDANIYNVDAEKEGDNNTSWTTDLAVVYRNGTVSEMKTKIIDNEAHRVDFDDPHITLKREDVTANKTMEISKKYLVSGNYELTLPTSPSKGDVIDILSHGYAEIIQNDSEHVISLRNKYFTTKGVNGNIELRPNERLQLVYKGSGLSPIEPMVKLSTPTGFGASDIRGCDFSYDAVYLAVAHTGTPYVSIFKKTGDVFAKLTNPSTLPDGNAKDVAFSNDGVYLVVVHDTSPYITIYKRTAGTDTFVKLNDVTGGNPPDVPLGVDFSPEGDCFAVAHLGTPFVTVYNRTGDAFAKSSYPSSLPPDDASSVRFSYDGKFLAVGHATSPYITIYIRFGVVFIKIANPSQLPVGVAAPVCLDFSPDGKYIIIDNSGDSGDVSFINGNIITFIQALYFGGAPAGGEFSQDSRYLAVAYGASPYVSLYKRGKGGYSEMTDPVSLPSGAPRDVSISEDGTYVAVVTGTSPYIEVYKTKETVNKEWIITDYEVLNSDKPGCDGDLQYRFK